MSEVANIPQLRFPEFGDNWEEKKLGNVTSIVMGQSPDSTSYNSNGIGLYLIQGNADIKKRKTLPRVWTDTPTKECKVGDIIMTVRAPVGAVAKSIHNACIGRGVCAIRNNQHSVSNYIYQFLLSFEKKWVKFEQGSTFTAVNTKDVKSLKLILPPVQEQTKIAAFLTAVDNKIEQLSKKQALLGEYKKGSMQKIFSQEIRFKSDDGYDFPDWEEKKLGDLIAEISDGGTPPTSNKGNFGGGINWVVIDDIRDEIRITKETLTETGLSNSSSKLWKPETIILSTGATIGRVGIAKIYTTTKQGVCGIVVNQFTSNLFLKYWFIFNINLLKRFSQGSSIKEVRPPTLIKFDISTPSLPEQTKIANFLSSIDSKIEQVGKQLDESKQFKKALLQQMFV